VPRPRLAPEDDRAAHARVGEASVDRVGGEQVIGMEMSRERSAHAVPGEGEEQRRDQPVEGRLVDVPLVEAVIRDGQAAVDRRHLRGGRRRKLRRQLGEQTLRSGPDEQRMSGMPLEERPAERVEVDEDDALEAFP
jgi:hypothetical protein